MRKPNSTDEFSLIDEIVLALRDRAGNNDLVLGPGDDASVVNLSADHQMVSSLDALLQDVHFPAFADPEYIGYRAIMVAMSDLAAMGARGLYCLVGLSRPQLEVDWVQSLARGMANAAREIDVYVAGGNLARGPCQINISVHGEVPNGTAITRARACVGDKVYVSGALGGAAKVVEAKDYSTEQPLTQLQQRYYQPKARLDLSEVLRATAHAAIDISDGLVQDAGHICAASKVGINLNSQLIPIFEQAMLAHALYGGDDYELLCTAAQLPTGFKEIGEVVADHVGEVWVDHQPPNMATKNFGYNHFG